MRAQRHLLARPRSSGTKAGVLKWFEWVYVGLDLMIDSLAFAEGEGLRGLTEIPAKDQDAMIRRANELTNAAVDLLMDPDTDAPRWLGDETAADAIGLAADGAAALLSSIEGARHPFRHDADDHIQVALAAASQALLSPPASPRTPSDFIGRLENLGQALAHLADAMLASLSIEVRTDDIDLNSEPLDDADGTSAAEESGGGTKEATGGK